MVWTQERLDQLDAEELYHLALHASEKGDHDDAITLLKQSQTLQPNANTLYILAAEHAEIGMYQRAAEEMARATEMDPELWTAHFQQGLLHMMLNQAEQATNAWEKLQQLNEDDALHQFGRGMIYFINGELEQAQTHLQQGIDLNQSNPALNGDIRKILKQIEETIEDSTDAVDSESQKQGSHLFLAEYNKDDGEVH